MQPKLLKKLFFSTIVLVNFIFSVDYESEIQTIFDSNCTSCHDADHASGLDLTSGSSYNSIFDNEAVEPGESSASELYDRITRDNADDGDMPPGNAELDTPEIDLIGQWINGEELP
jgi:mono/diheme cytochrome c family protein